MKSDLEIAQTTDIWPIEHIVQKAGLTAAEIIPYGRHKAKVDFDPDQHSQENGQLILVTSINPTPAGEGKSTVAVGLADALNLTGAKTMLALREPSLGPVMGMKGGATGGGYAQVVPMEEINLHLTGDFHALTVAQNTLVALVDNSIYQGNPLQIDPSQVLLKRALDVNDRQLRDIVTGVGGHPNGVLRESGFEITAASELMAILTLATDLTDLQERIDRIVVGYTYDQQPVTVAQLRVGGAITALLKDALKPNLVQTLGHTPTLIHGGPFANIAQGTNSIQATRTALKLADYVVTEAGFGADLGGEKFLDVKTPLLGQHPNVIVIVATVRALKMHGGVAKNNLTAENIPALTAGLANLEQHIFSMKRYGVPVVVAVNQFATDTDAELKVVTDFVAAQQLKVAVADVWGHGGQGATDLARIVLQAATEPAEFQPLYLPTATPVEKLTQIVQVIYGGSGVTLTAKAKRQLQTFQELGWAQLPIIVAKTQYSLSDDPKKLAAPTDFKIHVREFVPKLGAGFLVALTGKILTMPGLPKHPAAEQIKVDSTGKITGLF